jgi:hypothetical protein
MPLDRHGKSQDALNKMHDFPLDEEARYNCDYTTKTQIYDSKCSGCGFAYIVAKSADQTVRIFKDIKNANIFNTGCSPLERSCEYPSDITIQNNKEKLPSLSEIISNGCQFWNEDRLDIADGEFIEVENVNEFNGLQPKELSQFGSVREELHCEIISQSETAG